MNAYTILNQLNFASIFINSVLDEEEYPLRSWRDDGAVPDRKVCSERHVIFFLFAVCLLLTGMLGGIAYVIVHLKMPDVSTVANYDPPQATLIYDRNGAIIERFYKENRTLIPLSEMHHLLPKAFVAAEDGRFYEHSGLDFISVIRALLNNIREGRRGQGGSTITQQVAKSLLLTPEKTYIRKFKEAILAWRIDSLLTKDEILYIYLNQIYLGEGAYGVEAASRVYFGKKAKDLTLAEVAILAGLPQAPSKYSPSKNPEAAAARQKYVLNRMASEGFISAEMAQEAFQTAVTIRSSYSPFDSSYGYYLEIVKHQANEFLQQPLIEMGAKIYTNLDQNMQNRATQAVQAGVRASLARQKVQGRMNIQPQGALVCLERISGKVRALVGGTDYSASSYNRAYQAKRPAGSSFKPFVYLAALEQGWQPQSIIDDSPLSVTGENGSVWEPKNYTREFHGETTLAMALAHSYNAATVRLMQHVGVKRVYAVARDVGITSEMPADLSLALGTVDVSLVEMTAAFTPFVNDGMFIAPSFIDRIEYRNGTTLRGAGGEKRQVCESATARQMKSMLEGVVRYGTAQRAKGLPGVTGGKTGTSDNSRDAWFIGFNGDLITGVWVGNDHNEPLGYDESGGHTAVPIWYDFMKGSKR